ncbi:MAG: DUF3822 family protein [Bacteroidales bacterium]|nr:DUF3822 family protein [Bacteroidales bacterium]
MSICPRTDGFSFCETTTRGEWLAFGEVSYNATNALSELIATVKGAMAACNLHPGAYGETELVVNTSRFEWIPQHLFDAANTRSYLETLGTMPPASAIYVDLNDTLNAYVVFTADSTMVSAFKIAMPSIKVRCQHSKMVNNQIVEKSPQATMLINVGDGMSDYATFSNRKLQMSNSFTCGNFDETLYYALNIAKQFSLDEQSLKVLICGDVNRQRYGMLCNFFHNVELYTGRPLRLAEPALRSVPAYRYALMLS